MRITPLSASTRCVEYRGWCDVRLLLRALRLLWAAQAVRSKPLAQVLEQMRQAKRGNAGCGLEQVVCATLRACHHGRRWFGWLDSCLTRSLVAGMLADGSGEVLLHIGFIAPDEASAVNGHAWVTVGSVLLFDDRDPEHPDSPYQSVLKLRMD